MRQFGSCVGAADVAVFVGGGAGVSVGGGGRVAVGTGGSVSVGVGNITAGESPGVTDAKTPLMAVGSGVGVSSCESHDVTNSALASKRNRTREAILSVFIFPPIFVPFASRFAGGTCDCVFRTRPTWILIGSWSIESQSSVEGSGLVVTAGPIITGESGFV